MKDYLKVKLVSESEPILFEMEDDGETTFDTEDGVLWIKSIGGVYTYFPLRGVQYYIYSKGKPR